MTVITSTQHGMKKKTQINAFIIRYRNGNEMMILRGSRGGGGEREFIISNA